MSNIFTNSNKIIFGTMAIIFFLAANTAFCQNPRYISSRDLAVLISATPAALPTAKITLKWSKNEQATKYHIKRKDAGVLNFPSSYLVTLDTNTTSYVDNNVVAGKLYEYEITADSYGSMILQFVNNETQKTFDSTVARIYRAYGYIASAIEAPEQPAAGKVLLVVDSTIAEPLKAELDRLIDDLALEGWGVIVKLVPRTEQFNGDEVLRVKDIITNEYYNDDALTTVFLLGRVAVPYSGLLNPDGHPDHYGAWPADMYYGQLSDFFWTDINANRTTASREENKNIPGDGKFDQTALTSGIDVTLAVGRVDFYNMPIFINDSTYTEIERYRNYLNKDHNYRTGAMSYEMKGLVDDNFGANSYTEAFASSGWRNLAALCGPNNVSLKDYFGTLKNDSYLWAYGCGGGTYTSCGGVGSTPNFLAQNVNVVFSMLFGSYFGDWDSQNNFLRAGLLSNPMTLTCAWAARPPWFLHHMAAGYPIGYSTLLSQNNYTEYIANTYWFNLSNPQGVIAESGNQDVHIALMGDPTLRMFPTNIGTPENLSVTQPLGKPVELKWNPSASSPGKYYNVFKSVPVDGKPCSPNGPFIKINTAGISGMQFVDSTLYDGTVYYIVSSVGLVYSNTCSFFSRSRGARAEIIATGVDEQPNDLQYSLVCNPNPAVDHLNMTLTLPSPENVRLAIFDTKGTEIKSLENCWLASGSHQFNWDLNSGNGGRVAPGIYFVRINSNSRSEAVKFVVMP